MIITIAITIILIIIMIQIIFTLSFPKEPVLFVQKCLQTNRHQ